MSVSIEPDKRYNKVKSRFNEELFRYWEEGIQEALDKYGVSTTPFDCIVHAVCGIVTIYGIGISPDMVRDKWGSLLCKIPTNADPRNVIYSLKETFSWDFEI